MTRRLRLALVLAVAAHPSTALADGLTVGDHLTLSVSDRVRGELVSWFDPGGPKSNNDYAFFANRLRFGATFAMPVLEVVVEGQDTRLVNLPGADAINTGPGTRGDGPLGPGALYFANTRTRDQGEVFLHLAYATVRDFGLPGVSARVGRFGYNNGLERPAKDPSLLWLQRARISQRLIGNFDYTNVGRSFDGVQALYDQGPWNVTLMGSHPTYGGYNVNANKTIDDVDLAAATASFVEPEELEPTMAQLFYMYYADRRHLVATDNRARDLPTDATCTGANRRLVRACDHGSINVHTIGADAVQVLEAGPGKVDILEWAAVQLGEWQALDHHAWAYAVEAGYQLPDVALKPWARVGWSSTSGDSDPRDGDHQTFFQMIPTARLYALFPFFNMMNDQDLFAQGIVRPVAGLTATVSAHYLRATSSRDLWYAGGGATSDTFFGFSGINARGRNQLAYLTDLEVAYTVNKHLALYGYYGHAFGQGIVAANFTGPDADYGYLEATVSF